VGLATGSAVGIAVGEAVGSVVGVLVGGATAAGEHAANKTASARTPSRFIRAILAPATKPRVRYVWSELVQTRYDLGRALRYRGLLMREPERGNPDAGEDHEPAHKLEGLRAVAEENDRHREREDRHEI
jgi:hypothetical protein